jgi:hypothetical protein
MKRILGVLLFLISSIGSPLFADYVQGFGQNSKVNWSKGEISATGFGMVKTSQWTTQQKIEAHRAATLDAMRQLLEAVNNISIDSQKKVGDIENTLVKKRISGMIKNFTERGAAHFEKNGTCTAEVMIPLNGDGSIADIVLSDPSFPKATDFEADPTDTAKTNIPKSAVSSLDSETLPTQSTPATKEKKETEKILKVYQKKDPVLLVKNTSTPESLAPTPNISGLVVKVSGDPVRPALSPKIVTENGSEVYGFHQADPDFRKNNGLASYATDINDAKLDKRVTENPFVIDAVKVDDASPCTIIIREEDADKFMKLDGSDRVLKRCRVIIVSKNKTEHV